MKNTNLDEQGVSWITFVKTQTIKKIRQNKEMESYPAKPQLGAQFTYTSHLRD